PQYWLLLIINSQELPKSLWLANESINAADPDFGLTSAALLRASSQASLLPQYWLLLIINSQELPKSLWLANESI
ncbi:hypothetical protein, partial [Pseudomonas sp. MH10]|uniref:hypothetical protein n=1 Tax=Pseudomonas sp. MH10 TaxID=3048627 RepID=UPI002B23622E